MTVNSADITSGPYAGNGVADSFSYDFRIENKNQLYVWETDDNGVQTLLTVDTDYTVTGVDNDAGGTVTRVAGALPSGYEWYIRSNRSPVQSTAFASQGGFFPWVHEEAFDHLTYLIQQLDDRLNRTIRTALGDSSGGFSELPSDAADRANTLLYFDEDGDVQLTLYSQSDVELNTNKATDFSNVNNTLYPSTQAVADYVAVAGGGNVSAADSPVDGSLPLWKSPNLVGTMTAAEARQKLEVPTSLADITSIADLNTAALVDGQQFHMTGWRTGSDLGGGDLYYDSSRPQTDHDGGTVFALDATPPTDFNDPAQIEAYLNAGSGLSGDGCLVRERSGDLYTWDFGAIADGVANDLAQVVAAHAVANATKQWLVVAGPSLLDLNEDTGGNFVGIEALSGDRIRFEGEGKFVLPDILSEFYGVIRLGLVENVKILNPVIIGDRDVHSGTTGEKGELIGLRGCKNVLIKDPVLSKAWGDSLYIGEAGSTPSENVTVVRGRYFDSRRQGISLISGRDIYIYEPKIYDISGINPQAGIDIEPNSNSAVLENIRIVRPSTKNCANQGILVYLNSLISGGTAKRQIDIVITDPVDDGSSTSFALTCDNAAGIVGGQVSLVRPVSKNSEFNGILAYDWDADGPRLVIDSPVVENTNTMDTASSINGFGILVRRNTGDPGPIIGNVLIKNPAVYDDRATVLTKAGIYVRDFENGETKKIVVQGSSELSDPDVPVRYSSDVTHIDESRSMSETLTSSREVRSFSMNKIFNTDGQTTQKTVTLRDDLAVSAFVYEFDNTGDDNLVIVPESATILTKTATAGTSLTTTEKGASIKLKKVSSTEWMIVGIVGTWT